jgi:4'-phosphopantetheinyl transferase EntD
MSTVDNKLISLPLGNLFTADFFTGACRVDDYAGLLSSEEKRISQGFGKKRKEEFSTGRYLAKSLLCKAGCEVQTIAATERGRPLWPAGISGSISHCDQYCVSAVTSSDDYSSVGIDIEETGRLEYGDCERFMCSAELDHLAAIEPQSRNQMLTIVFSLKEAVYKCLNPVFGKWIDYEDAAVDIASAADGRINIAVAGYGQTADHLECRYLVAGPYIVTSAVLYKSYS